MATGYVVKPDRSKMFAGNHRDEIGGIWEKMAKHQFDFMKEQVAPHEVVLDLACGSLRLGCPMIEYLDTGNYLGLDIDEGLIQSGIDQELGLDLYYEKQPQLVVSSDFDFSHFDRAPDYVMIQSLFTHFSPDDIKSCLRSLYEFAKPTTVVFATFFVLGARAKNAAASHPHKNFRYTREQIADFASSCGYVLESLAGWNHPRKQLLAKLQPVYSKVFVVLGMHRSGTSLIAKALNNEIHMGDELIIARNPTQPKGYYESKLFHVLNGDLLEAAGGDRKGLVTIPAKEDILALGDTFGERIRDTIYQESRDRKIWGWKDPRTTLTIELFMPYLPKDVHIIPVFRRPSTVIDSIRRRDVPRGRNFSYEVSAAVTKIYNQRLLDFLSKFTNE
jgi:hypothetical protein